MRSVDLSWYNPVFVTDCVPWEGSALTGGPQRPVCVSQRTLEVSTCGGRNGGPRGSPVITEPPSQLWPELWSKNDPLALTQMSLEGQAPSTWISY